MFFAYLTNFKTSYVIVYLGTAAVKVASSLFQNILCYCLSKSILGYGTFNRISKHLMLLFILYLSCRLLDLHTYFKTSYVIVYLHPGWRVSAHALYFKTSYVIVYRYRSSEVGSCGIISKHLMLLFIPSPHIPLSLFLDFKTSYVIVYPVVLALVDGSITNFKTSYVIVYLRVHSMKLRRNVDFKTSYVIVYPYSCNNSGHCLAFQNILCYCLSIIVCLVILWV